MHRKKGAFFYLLLSIMLLARLLPAQPGLQQSLSLQLDNVPISDALLEISSLSGVDILFSSHFFSSDQRVSISVNSASLDQVLEQCLANTGIGFQLKDGWITLYRQEYTISGYVVDAKTGERLVGANIMLPGANTGTYTNSYGFFSLTLPRGEYEMLVSYLGYQKGEERLRISENQRLNLALAPSLTLNEVVVLATKNAPASLKHAQLSLPALQKMPQSLGEPDLFRSLDFLPGIQSGGDGFGGLSVRGGGNGQNLILLDDVPIYHPTHALGLFSIFNPNLIRDVKIYKDGFPARYSGRLASVMDIRNREGNHQEWSGSVGISGIASQLLLESPILQKKGAVLLAGRRTHLDPLLQSWGNRQKEREGTMGERNYRFFDLNLKSWYAFNENNKVYLSFYAGGDRFSDQTESEKKAVDDLPPSNTGFDRFLKSEYAYDWGNRMVSLRWNHLFGERLFSNLTLIHSRFSYANEYTSRAEATFGGTPILAVQNLSRFQSSIRKEALRLDLDYYGRDHHLQFGGHLAQLEYTPSIQRFQEEEQQLDSLIMPLLDTRDTVRLRTLEAGVYIQDRVQWGDLEVIAGFHLATLQNNSTGFWAWQPRLQLFYHLQPGWDIHLSGSRMVQFLHLLTTTDAGLPNDLWVPASENIPPQYAWQAAAGMSAVLGEEWAVDIDLFWNEMENIAQFRNGLLRSEASLAIDAGNWEDVAFMTDGRSYGLEFLLRRQQGKIRPWLAYTWSRTFRQIGTLQLPVARDHRHRIAAALQWNPAKNWQLSTSWHFFSSAPLSPVLETNQQLSFLQLLPATSLPAGSIRLPNYHRMDINVTYSLQKRHFRHEFTFGVYNLYDRSNGLFLLEQQLTDQGPIQFQFLDGLPVLPSLRYQLSF